jgi:O-antigen/teichoic acid export membrane protein
MIRTNARLLLRSTLVYSLNVVIGPLFTLVLTPIYTRVLPQAELGVIDTVLTLGMVLSTLGMLGLITALGVLLHEQPDEPAQLRLIATALWLAAGGCGLLAALAIMAAQPLAQLWLGQARFAPEVALYLLNLPFGALYAIQSAALRLRQEAWRASALGITQVLLLAALNLLLVVWLRYGALGALGAQTLSYVLLSALGFALAPRSLLARQQAALARPLILAGLPLVPAGLASWALGYLDRPLLIQLGIGLDQIAVYGIGSNLASMLALLSLPFLSAWTPFALSIRAQPDAPRAYARALSYFVAAMLGAALALALFAHEALLLIGTYRYLDAQRYVWLLAYTPLIQGSYTIITTGLYLARKTPHLAWTTALGALANLLLNLLLAPQLGTLGAALATPLGYLCGAAAAYVVAQRSYPVPYEQRRLLGALAAQALLLALGLPLGAATTPASLALRGLLLLAYPAALIGLGVIARSDIALAWGWLRRTLSPIP